MCMYSHPRVYYKKFNIYYQRGLGIFQPRIENDMGSVDDKLQ